MPRKAARKHVFVETDGQVYLVRDRGTFRFPRTDEKLPFRTDPNGTMDFGTDQVEKRTPRLDHHPEEWMGRDAVFERSDVDPLVKRAIYTTMIRCVSEVVISKGPRVLMVKAVRGFSEGYWNIPGGFMDYGEGPETGVKREAEEEIGADVSLDRDGVINRGREGYVRTPPQFEFLPGAIAGMRLLQDAGWRLVIVTNQDASGWKLVPERQLARIHETMLASLRREGVRISAVYYCPHHVLSDCACRKPRPGMLLAAARDLGVRPRTAWMVGDKPLDIQTGRAFGCRTAWVGPPSWRKRFAEEVRGWSPEVVADNLRNAAAVITKRGA